MNLSSPRWSGRKRLILRIAAAAPGIFLCALLALALGDEAISVGVIADPRVIADYHFGSEAMVGIGGWRYKSAGCYATSAGIEAIAAVGIAIWLVRMAQAVSACNYTAAYACLVVLVEFLRWPALP